MGESSPCLTTSDGAVTGTRIDQGLPCYMITPALWNAYQSTYFRVEGECLFLNFAIITAYNPGSNVLPDVVNCANNTRLAKRLRHYHYLLITAGDKHFDWCEESFAVEIGLDKAIAVARDFSQNAIFYVSDGQLYLYSCHDDGNCCLGHFTDRIIKS